MKQHYQGVMSQLLQSQSSLYMSITEGFLNNDLRILRKSINELKDDKFLLKNSRRKEIVAMRKMKNQSEAIQASSWLHQGFSSCEQMLYCLRRVCDPCKEHVDNNFSSLPSEYAAEFTPLRNDLYNLMTRVEATITAEDFSKKSEIVDEIDLLKDRVKALRKKRTDDISETQYNPDLMILYVTILQESEELLYQMKHFIKAVSEYMK